MCPDDRVRQAAARFERQTLERLDQVMASLDVPCCRADQAVRLLGAEGTAAEAVLRRVIGTALLARTPVTSRDEET